jgi:hypothetical protein
MRRALMTYDWLRKAFWDAGASVRSKEEVDVKCEGEVKREQSSYFA